jgi:hypothetical protein
MQESASKFTLKRLPASESGSIFAHHLYRDSIGSDSLFCIHDAPELVSEP